MQEWVPIRIDDNFFKVMQQVNHQLKVNKEEVKVKYKDGELYKFCFDWIDEDCCGIELFKQIEVSEPEEKVIEDVKE